MPGGQGLRHRTRDLFQRGFRQKGFIPLTTYLRTYKLGDYVDIKMNPAQQKVRWSAGYTVGTPKSEQQPKQKSAGTNSNHAHVGLALAEHIVSDLGSTAY